MLPRHMGVKIREILDALNRDLEHLARVPDLMQAFSEILDER